MSEAFIITRQEMAEALKRLKLWGKEKSRQVIAVRMTGDNLIKITVETGPEEDRPATTESAPTAAEIAGEPPEVAPDSIVGSEAVAPAEATGGASGEPGDNGRR